MHCNFITALVVTLSCSTVGHGLPNILLFVADDLGYGDLGCFGNTSMRTPNLDRLAVEGAKLTHSLAAASLCTPSRAAFLTGRYPIRSGMAPSNNARAIYLTACDSGLPVHEITIGEVAKLAGYKTAVLGKWHLGWNEDQSDPLHMHPLNQGFDYFYGIPLTNMKDFDPRETKAWHIERPSARWLIIGTSFVTLLSIFLLITMARLGRIGSIVVVGIAFAVFIVNGLQYWVAENLQLLNSFFYRNYKLVEQPVILSQVMRKLVMEGIKFLQDRHADQKPFLLLISWLHVHTALATGPSFKEQSGFGPYGDAVQELDWGVGELLRELESLGMARNTLVYFTSDNGAHIEEFDFKGRRAGGWNANLKGGKGHGASEGGIRVPTLVRWPGKVPGGLVITEPVSLMDVLPTIAHALEVDHLLPANLVLDGKNLLPLLSGSGNWFPHEFLFHYCQDQVHAVRYRPVHNNSNIWKLVFYEPNYLPATNRCHYICSCDEAKPLNPPSLFELNSDPGERRPLSAKDVHEYHVLVKLMLKALQEHQRSIKTVPNQFAYPRMLWKPWAQPMCNFPSFRCTDPNFADHFKSDLD